jgi:hypothetical protein
MQYTSTEVLELKDHWKDVLPGEALPADDQWAIWRAMHKASVIRSALTQTAVKRKKVGAEMSGGRIIRFASSIMTRLSREASTMQHVRRIKQQ